MKQVAKSCQPSHKVPGIGIVPTSHKDQDNESRTQVARTGRKSLSPEKINYIELFSGSRTFSKEAEDQNITGLAIDSHIKDSKTWAQDITQITPADILKRVGKGKKIFWASPPCPAWSKMGWHHHWDKKLYANARLFVPVSETANQAVLCVRKSIELFCAFPDAIFFMENPEGLLSRHPVIQEFVKHPHYKNIRRVTVTYCQYEHPHRKPTMIWTNSTSWNPKPACMASDKCHLSSPRTSKNPLHGLKDSAFERSKIPVLLARECIEAAKKDLRDLGSPAQPEITKYIQLTID